jgi:hypothetical protein
VKHAESSRSSRRQSIVLDLTAYDGTRRIPEPVRPVDRAAEFYREHAEEILARMRNPTSPIDNPAAAIVAKCEPNARLRAEAEEALESARTAREARRALDMALAAYGPRGRAHASGA